MKVAESSKASVKDDGSKVSVPVYVNYLGVEDKKNNKPFKTYVVIVSGLCFDQDVNNTNYSTNDMLEDFNRRHDSVHKCSLPPPKDSGKDFRKSFLETAGYYNDQNYDLLTYLKCVSYSNEKGNMDILKFKCNNDWVNRRFPTYFIDIRNKFNSNADEFGIDLSVKVQDLLRDIADKEFQFSSKGELGKKRIEYVIYEARADLINHPESKEYKQVKLLLACVDSIKEKEHKRSSELSPNANVTKVAEDIPEVPFEVIYRTPSKLTVGDGKSVTTPNTESTLLTRMHLCEVSSIGKEIVQNEEDSDLATAIELSETSVKNSSDSASTETLVKNNSTSPAKRSRGK